MSEELTSAFNQQLGYWWQPAGISCLFTCSWSNLWGGWVEWLDDIAQSRLTSSIFRSHWTSILWSSAAADSGLQRSGIAVWPSTSLSPPTGGTVSKRSFISPRRLLLLLNPLDARTPRSALSNNRLADLREGSRAPYETETNLWGLRRRINGHASDREVDCEIITNATCIAAQSLIPHPGSWDERSFWSPEVTLCLTRSACRECNKVF